MINYNRENTILKDQKKNGKEKPWRINKIGSKILSNSYLRQGIKRKGERVFKCGERLFFRADPSNLNDKVLYQTYFCGDKLCPLCAMRRTDKLYGQTSKIVEYIQKEWNYRFIFLTLTIRNMPGDGLKAAIDGLMKGFNLLTKRKEFKALSKGWMRSMEVTVNWQTNDYHPHLHVIIAVDDKYFTDYENYLKHEEWLRLWKSCMRLDYDPSVNVKKVRGNKACREDGSISYGKAVSELTKYTVKSADILVTWSGRERFEKKTGIKLRDRNHAFELTDGVVGLLSDVLHNRRLVAFGGCMKTVHKMLNLDDPTDGDLLNVDGKTEKKEKYTVEVVYKWCPKTVDYVLDIALTDPIFLMQRRE